MTEDFGEGYGKVPQETLDYFHDLAEENMKVLAIKMTSIHCKGVEYDLDADVAMQGIADGGFRSSALNGLLDGVVMEKQESYYADGPDKTGVVKPKKK